MPPCQGALLEVVCEGFSLLFTIKSAYKRCQMIREDASLWVERYQQLRVICGIYVTGTEIGLRKRQRGSDAVILNGVPAWMPVDVQTNGHISNVHAQWFSHWKIKADDHEVMK